VVDNVTNADRYNGFFAEQRRSNNPFDLYAQEILSPLRNEIGFAKLEQCDQSRLDLPRWFQVRNRKRITELVIALILTTFQLLNQAVLSNA
jgi:hypothetical protein